VAINPDDERVLSWLSHVRAQAPAAGRTLPQPRRRWQCPLCSAGSLVEVQRCPRCRAVVSLADLDALLGNQDVDAARLGAAIGRLEALSGDKVDFAVHYKLGLAYLNCKRLHEGVTRLRVACQLRPEDTALRQRVDELIGRQAESARLLARLARPPAGSGKRIILVVDDSPTVLKIVGMALERQGHEVVVAANALQALAKLDELTPDLVLLDITMPHMDGYQLCKLIRANPATTRLPVVMLSGKDGFFDKMRGRLAGSTDYITKPFDPATLIQAVEKHCRREAC
jgi:twitching motility two-component system response regulator PilG